MIQLNPWMAVLVGSLCILAPLSRAADLPFSLRAMSNGRQVLWEMKYKKLPDLICQFTLTEAELLRPKILRLKRKECDEIRELVSKISQSLPANDQPSQQIVLDEPIYEVKMASRSYWAEFKAPQECDIQPSGDLKCAAQNLSPIQKLVMILRDKRLQAD